MLSITKTEIVYLIVIFVVTIVFWVFCFNKLNAICIHRSVAKSKGIHVRLLDNLFAVLVALIVMLSIKYNKCSAYITGGFIKEYFGKYA